ncbi:MAG: hypothetical protein R2710_28160 [Acidimicrobiales bacterium]
MTDEQLFDQLRKLLEDSPSDDVVDRAKDLWDVRTIGEEIAELTSDSFEQLPVGVRRAASLERDLLFEFDDLELAIRLDGPDLLGQVIGEPILSARLVTLDDEQPVEVDDLGSFWIERPSSDVLRVALVTDSGRRLSTEWIRL